MPILNLELIANGKETTETLQFNCLVHKHIEQVIYFPRIDDRNIPVAYFQGEEPDSWKNIKIVDKSYLAKNNRENRLLKNDNFIAITGRVYNSDFRDILVTGKTFITKEGLKRPLFYRHKVGDKVVDINISRIENSGEVQIEEGFLVDYEEGYIYTNYQNTYDYKTDSYSLFFVNSVNEKGENYNGLLNLEPAIPPVSWELIDPDTGEYIRPSYEIEETTDSKYKITIHGKESLIRKHCGNQSEVTFFLKLLDTNVIKPKLPAGRTIYNNWNIRFTNGSFIQSVNAQTFKYWIPEYYRQPFAPEFQVLYKSHVKCTLVNPKIIKTPRTKLYVDVFNGQHLTLFLYSQDKTLFKVLTTDAGLEGRRYSNTEILYESDGIVSVDEKNGFIQLNFDVGMSEFVFASFFYKTDDYEYRMSLNPTENTLADVYKWVYYLIPINSISINQVGENIKAVQCIGVNKQNIIQ